MSKGRFDGLLPFTFDLKNKRINKRMVNRYETKTRSNSYKRIVHRS
jgi:hypothetical protein